MSSLQAVPAGGDRPADDRVSHLRNRRRRPGHVCRPHARLRTSSRTASPHDSVPVLTPFLSSLWLGLITPLYARIGRKLIESIVHSTVVRDASALAVFDVHPVGVEEAIVRAMAREESPFAATRWSDALSSSGALPS